MKKIIVFFSLAAFFPIASYAAAITELHVGDDRSFSATNLVVIQKGGPNIFARAVWDNAFIRVTVLAQKDTVITRNHGEPALVSDIKEGDILNVVGKLQNGDGALTVKPTTIRDISLDSAALDLKGKIQSIDTNNHSFVVLGANGTSSIQVNSTTTITKGVRSISFSELKKGDTMLSSTGVYDHGANVQLAETITVYQDPTVFLPRVFVGVLKSISLESPATLIVTAEGVDYRVILSDTTSLLNNAKKATKISRFSEGDHVRVYGAITKSDLTLLVPEVVRDTDF